MTDDPAYPRQTILEQLGVITEFVPISMTEVPRGMLLKLGAPLSITPEEMVVEQTPDKDIIVSYRRPETDEEYWARVNALKEAEAEAARQAAAILEVEVSWQKFKQLADRFADRILTLTIHPDYS